MTGSSNRNVLRLAMWSGPRNISTACMRSWGNRDDTLVVDEPFYAHYLVATGLDHPGRAEVIASQPTDWRRVAQSLVAPLPAHIRIHYQKQMAHHLLPHMGRDWLAGLTHGFLIRDPRAMLASLEVRLGDFDLLATGLPQQVEIFEHVLRTTGRPPPVVDSADLVADPQGSCVRSAASSACHFQSACSGGRPDRATRTVSGRVTGTTASSAPPVSNRRRPGRPTPMICLAHLPQSKPECRPLYEYLRKHRLRASGD